MSKRSLGSALTPSATLTVTNGNEVMTIAQIGPMGLNPNMMAASRAKTRPGVVMAAITQSWKNPSHQRLPMRIPMAVPRTYAIVKPMKMRRMVAQKFGQNSPEVIISPISLRMSRGDGSRLALIRFPDAQDHSARNTT